MPYKRLLFGIAPPTFISTLHPFEIAFVLSAPETPAEALDSTGSASGFAILGLLVIIIVAYTPQVPF